MTARIDFHYKTSIDSQFFGMLNAFVSEKISTNNNSDFDYLSISLRNHRINLATSIPSNPNVIKDYIAYNLIDIDPLACFERFTTKKILTFSEVKNYKNHGKCGKSYLALRKKSGLRHGFHYIHRHEDWSYTVVFGSSLKKGGFAADENLIERNSTWLNTTIGHSLKFIEQNKHLLINDKVNLIYG